jgi:hypothetical protein
MSNFNFPNQRIPEKLKDEEWHKQHIMSYIQYSVTSYFTAKKNEIEELYYAANAMLSPGEQEICRKMVTERFGLNFGPKYEVYPLIEKTIEDVLGDYRKRPLKRKALVKNQDAVIKKLDAKIDVLLEKELRAINEEVQTDLGFVPETPKPEIQIPDDIEEEFSKNYRTVSEEIAEEVLYQTLVVRKEKERLYDALKHFLIAEEAFGVCDQRDGHPSIFIPHPLDSFYDYNMNYSVQDDMQYFVYDKFLSINEVFNTYKLSKEQMDTVENYAGMQSHKVKYNPTHWFKVDSTSTRVRVVFMKWISRKTSKFLAFKNKEGKEELKILPDNYKQRKDRNEDIRSVEIEDVRHIFMVGPDVVLSFGPDQEQMQTIGNMKKRFIDAVGLVGRSSMGTGNIRSLAKKLKPLQDFASEILYEIRLNARQLDGNVLVYDTSMIPKEWARYGLDKALEKVNFHLKRDRMQIINSKDKRSSGYANSANVSQKGRLTELIQLLALIENTAGKISGINDAANGQQADYTKATVAEMNLNSASARKEEYYGVFDSFVETLMTRLVLKSKFIYKENDVFTYFAGDNKAKFLKIMSPYFQEDLGIHIADNRKEYDRKNRIDQVGEKLFGSTNEPAILKNLIKMWNADSSTEAEAIFDTGVRALEEIKKANDERMMAIEEDKNAVAKAKLEQEDRHHKEELQNNLDVAKIHTGNKFAVEQNKEANANLREAAKIEKDLIIKNKQ